MELTMLDIVRMPLSYFLRGTGLIWHCLRYSTVIPIFRRLCQLKNL